MSSTLAGHGHAQDRYVHQSPRKRRWSPEDRDDLSVYSARRAGRLSRNRRSDTRCRSSHRSSSTVRLCIRCVLHAELQVDPGASPGVGLAEGHIIGFEDEGVLVGLASAPAAGRYRLAPDGDRQTDLHHSSSVVFTCPTVAAV